jgi:hypothetical protein
MSFRHCVFSSLVLLVGTHLHAQGAGSEAARDTSRKVLVVPGQRAGTSVFPLTNYAETKPLVAGQIDWKHYHTSAEIEEFMQRWAKERPDLIDLYVVGKSFGGRDVYQMTITNKKTGKDTDKPAAFFDGGRHSGEISGTESAFYRCGTCSTSTGRTRRSRS